MKDIKSLVSVIKILERTIGVLENCNDVGEISDLTRKRIIEMLNKATLEIYFMDNDSSGEKTSKPNIAPEKEQVIEISEISDAIEEKADEVLPEEEKVVIAEEPVPEEESNDIIPEEEFLVEEETFEETVEAEKEEEAEEEEEVAAEEEEEAAEEEEVAAEEEKEEFVEEENVVEDIPEENTISENFIFNQQNNSSDKPLFEWEMDKAESVAETQDDEINLLKRQLEEERKRLEQELQNWQDERRKRDEEILAAKKLLESLQQQTAINQAQQQTVTQPAVQKPQPTIQQQSQPTVQQPQPAILPNRKVQQPQQSTKSEPKKEESQEAIIDRFIGTKKVLHENFETNNMVNQISTPVASLPRAIGKNDRFRFIKELFGGDSDLYNETIKKLDAIGSLVSAISYIESNFSWDKNSDSVKQLISLIRRRYM
jgi:hypothetical protein